MHGENYAPPDREEVYERCKEYVSRNTVAHSKQRAVKEQQLKLSFVAHGDMSSDQVDTALKALAEQGVIVRAEGWLTIDLDKDDWYRQVIRWCAERDDPPRGLIGALNRRLSE